MKDSVKPLVKIVVPIAVVLILFQIGRWYGIVALAVLLIYLGFRLRTQWFIIQANSRFAKNDLTGAAECFDKAYKMSRRPAYAISRSFVLLKSGQAQEAEKLLADMLKKPLPHAEEKNAKVNYSLALWMLGRKEQSIELLESVFTDYKNTIVYGNLGLFYAMSGDLDKALSFNLEAYEYSDSDKTILDNLGYTYYKLGRYQDAKEIYERLIALKPAFTEAYYFYGMTLWELGEREQAMELMRKGLEFEPSMITNVNKAMLESKVEEWIERTETSVT